MESEGSVPHALDDVREVPAWSPWRPLRGAGRDREVPTTAGLYRIRSAATGRMLYLGQTGVSLRGRLSQLGGIWRDEMPFNDPHTAAPALWAHRVDTGEEFEASVVALTGNRKERMGREALEITRLRVLDGRSPEFCFGRMPPGWIKSTGNTAELVAKGKRARGHRERSAAPPPHVLPPASLDALGLHPTDAALLGLPWVRWSDARPEPHAVGVYRIADPDGDGLLYVGQGRPGMRLLNHEHQGLRVGKEDERLPVDLDASASWVVGEFARTQLLELENDLMAAHVWSMGRPPVAQF